MVFRSRDFDKRPFWAQSLCSEFVEIKEKGPASQSLTLAYLPLLKKTRVAPSAPPVTPAPAPNSQSALLTRSRIAIEAKRAVISVGFVFVLPVDDFAENSNPTDAKVRKRLRERGTDSWHPARSTVHSTLDAHGRIYPYDDIEPSVSTVHYVHYSSV